MAWVGVAALQYRAATGSRRFDGLLDGVVRWLLARRNADGLITGGPDVRWVSTEHNLEARAVFAGAGGLDDVVARMDAAIERELFVRDGAGRAHLRQGAGDDVRPLDVQAFGILWLLGQGRAADAAAVADEADRTLRVSGRTLAGIRGRFDGYRPFADAGTPDLIWMEGTLQMRLALAALGRDTDALDDSVDRWAALTGPDMLRHSERAAGEDYNVWPAAAPAAWLRLSRSSFALLR